MAMEQTKLAELIAFLRSQGVTSYKDQGLELVLGPVDKPLEKEETASVVQERDSLFGLTEQEQMDLYGTVVSKPG